MAAGLALCENLTGQTHAEDRWEWQAKRGWPVPVGGCIY